MSTKNKKERTPKERVERYVKNKKSWLERTGLREHYIIEFPERGKPPLLSRPAVWLLSALGGRIGVRFEDIKK